MRVTDPAVIAAIEAALMLSVYEARRLYRLRMEGQIAPPLPNPRARALLQRSRDRQAIPHLSDEAR